MSWIQSAFNTRISPAILFTILTLAAVLSAAALLHLLLRFLHKPRPPSPAPRPFQRQLQQLFHLHDSGLDQSHIDSLPVFLYRDVAAAAAGSKEQPFDCAVCLCEFTESDRLRLLPLCSHAFHLECIDTWLLSNSSCPLCRGVILSFENPVFYSGEVEDGNSESNVSAVVTEKRVFSVRLGKLKGGGGGGGGEVGEGSNGNLDCRRCYSMGSFQYVVADSELQVALFPSRRERVEGQNWNFEQGQNGNFGQGQNGNLGGERDWGEGDGDGKRISNRGKGESFSVSKIWLWSKKGRVENSRTTLYSNAINGVLP